MEMTKITQMDKYTQANATILLTRADEIIKSLGHDARWDRETLTVGEFVSLKRAIEQALEIVSDNSISGVEN
jgi:hypothetical protein